MQKSERDPERQHGNDRSGRHRPLLRCVSLLWVVSACATTGEHCGSDKASPRFAYSVALTPVDLGTLTCFDEARDATGSQRQARSLCYGATTTGPVDCYEAAKDDLLLSARQLVTLCRCASSIEPADCFAELYENTFDPVDRMVAICSPVASGEVDSYCRPRYRWWSVPYALDTSGGLRGGREPR